MKTINRITLLMLAALLPFYSCQNNDDIPDIHGPGAVQFSFGEINSGLGGSAFGQGGSAEGVEALEDARALVITIIDDQGNAVYTQEQIEVYNFSGTMVGEPLSIAPGNYQLTEFLVLDDQGGVIYATPIEGSEYDHLVTDPLHIEFTVFTDETTEVVPEVIDTSVFTPESFGYVTFRFTLVEHFNFLMAAFIYGENSQNFELTTAYLTIYEQGTQNALYGTDLGDTTNVIAVKDGFDYRLVVDKAGFNSVDMTFTNVQLKAFENDPLEVIFQEGGAMASESFVDSGQTFSTEGTDVASGDLDGDGDIDSFITRSNGQPSEVWLNDGSGNYSNSGQSIGSNNSHHVALGDLDVDGDLDAFIVNYSDQANTVWWNDGAANFSNSGQALGNNSSMYVVLGDLDGDGALDAIVANDASNPNVIWYNDGSGTFTSRNGEILGTSAGHGLSLGDVDQDGDLDAFLASYGQPNTLWLNDGAGVFTDSGQSLGNDQSERVELADLDGDSDLDAFVASNVFNSSPQPSRIWLNDGAGNFTDSGQALGDNNVNGLIVVDFDLDGDFDALTVSYYNEPYTLWLNDGNGNFADSGLSFGTHFGTGVTYGDFDGDGDTDFFVTHSGESHRLWLGEQN